MSEFLPGKRSLIPTLRDIRVGCVILAWSIWIGGFMFYFGVVVPVGGAIVGGSEQGFVTQQVTFKLNLIGLVALSVMSWNTWVVRSRLLVVTLIIMVLCHVGLFVMHHRLDALIEARSLAQSQFASLHESYEGLSTVQWIAAMAHLVGVVRAVCRSNGSATNIAAE